MNYLELINNFWWMDEQRGFNGNETRLYFFLLHLSNRLFWKVEWIEYGDEKMTANVGISSDVLRASRNKLKEAYLIDFACGGQGRRVKTRYRILTPITNPTPRPKLDPNSEPLPYYNKTKIKTKTKTNPTSKDERFSKREYVASGSDFDE
ncbi:hypothetical protein EZS27_009349 [termite gut metagenome]|uniref:Bacteriophage lambda Replication protein O N-terminal domain-containing protein n=1 Tax=termite gut metagenome TaxID=433724 RepID=A0A5J4SA09_9ZZZZ